MIKLPYLILFINTAIFAQNSLPKYELNWKVVPSEYLVYEVRTDQIEIDDKQYKDYLSEFVGNVTDLDSIDLSNKFKDVNKKMKNDSKNYKTLAVLSNNKERIDISLIRTKIDTSVNSTYRIPTGIQLRGSLNNDGSIYSYYLKPQQKNILAILFQLPNKSVSIGEKWNIDINWLSSDQNFICDSASKKSEATLVDVKFIDDNQIATIKYQIKEQIIGTTIIPWSKEEQPTNVSFEHIGIASFNITKGKWQEYDIINSTNMKGIQNASQKSRYILIESELDEFSKDLISN